jgi:hypothetical protein
VVAGGAWMRTTSTFQGNVDREQKHFMIPPERLLHVPGDCARTARSGGGSAIPVMGAARWAGDA